MIIKDSKIETAEVGFNYRCPQCGDQDHIDICAFVSVRINRLGAEIIEDENDIGPGHWSAENGAGCDACGFAGRGEGF